MALKKRFSVKMYRYITYSIIYFNLTTLKCFSIRFIVCCHARFHVGVENVDHISNNFKEQQSLNSGPQLNESMFYNKVITK